MYKFYESPTTIEEALQLKAHYGDQARIIAGGTDLLIEIDRGAHQTAAHGPIGVIDLTRIPGLAEIWTEAGSLHLGPLVTHNQCVASQAIEEKAFPLARASWEVGAPQIRNRATIAGNIITASPANDAIVPLLALDARVTVESAERGLRALPLQHFLKGFRQVDLAPDEILTQISIPLSPQPRRGTFIKLGLRRAQAISLLSVAIHLEFAQDDPAQPIQHAAISLGAVAATVVRAEAAEAFLVGKVLTEAVITEAAHFALDVATPIDDIRGSAAYRRDMVQTLVARGLRQLMAGEERVGWSSNPILLQGKTDGKWPVLQPQTAPLATDAMVGEAMVNGQPTSLDPQMSLLDSLRAAGFIGVKEGCAEGECGACTVFLDGMAVMACMVPSERAGGSEVVTVEGLRGPTALHPIQSALIESGGVQCGYCTPGFVMSGAKLLEERPQPSRIEAQEALTGNLCRCTGYRKIVDAVVMAGEQVAI